MTTCVNYLQLDLCRQFFPKANLGTMTFVEYVEIVSTAQQYIAKRSALDAIMISVLGIINKANKMKIGEENVCKHNLA